MELRYPPPSSNEVGKIVGLVIGYVILAVFFVLLSPLMLAQSIVRRFSEDR